ncbi:triose-phosphate isomerase [Solimicrobium silvestre]|uniref:Triosephosphate isomerase n=1 Tax=Solimicrobium silvestre TaxID=2099400 RepID=A0A2S9GVG4_9BURK|nr:triose-phosphate isomerase [Solimicrobium silvestre]PRC91700.1 tim: triose-phosphate isomerase [Solimicrobium silvestre]
MKQRRPLIAGNWKMNGSLVTNAVLLSELQSGIKNLSASAADCDVAVCVPAPYLAQVQVALQTSSIAWGAQDVSAQAGGAYTGEMSVSMLKDFSCAYAIVGHSERRVYHAESDALVAEKTLRLLEAGITPIVCVGETLQERKAGLTEATVARQLNAVLSVLDAAALAKIVVAYEPVWAIGTGITATPEMAQQVHAFLRSQLALMNAELAEQVQILYGGSMKPDNAVALLAMKDIDGGLIGGAALKSIDFLGIIAAAIE